jgi:GrpB-like predicted nucleotidyltransferase (UPF0157 family)
MPNSGCPSESLDRVEVVDFDAAWACLYEVERALLISKIESPFAEFEHIGSTSVPGLRAKPIIDMMAAVPTMQTAEALVTPLEALAYKLIETGMRDRLFFRKKAPSGQIYQLHIVELTTWPERNERLMRDYLREHPEAANAYGALKNKLAMAFVDDSLAYTKAKTAFIQGIIDRARAERGLPAVNVWED